MTALRVFIVDPSGEPVDSVARALAARADVSLVGRAHSRHEALRVLSERQPDLVLVDLRMPGMDGLEIAREIKKRAQATRVVIVTLHRHALGVCRAVTEAVGVDGFVARASFDNDVSALIAKLLRTAPGLSASCTPPVP